MDGFGSTRDNLVRQTIDVLDPSLRWQFDRQVVVHNLIFKENKMLAVHTRKLALAPDVDKIIARGTPGFSGADLANLSNEAALSC